MTPTAKGYFSGVRGLELGMQQAGVEVIQSLDLCADAEAVAAKNTHYFSHPFLRKDIKEIEVKKQAKTDIILGTWPCTRYSAIADIHGTRTGDDLFLHFFRHVALERPEMYAIENVPGMKKFKVVMEAFTQLPDYYVNVFCPVDAANWLPQRRKRLILIGTRKPFFITAPSPSVNRKRLKDILENNPEIEMPDYVISRINGQYRDKPIIVDPDQPGAVAPCCVAHYQKDRGTRLVKDIHSKHGVRPFTVREYARLQGFPDDYYFPNDSNSYRLIGNAVPVDMGRWVGQQAMRYFN